jgi:transposase
MIYNMSMKQVNLTRAQVRYQKRSEALAAVRRGETVTDVAGVLNVSSRAIFSWLARYRESGEQGLREGVRAGRPRKVTPAMMRWLYEAITQGDPQQHRFPFCLWTLGIIRTLLKRKHDIALSKSAVSRLLAHLGLSPQRPLYRSYQQDRKALEKYLKLKFPKLRALAKKLGAVIYFIDEASVRADAHRGTTWGKIGQTPIVKDSGQRFSIKMLSAVSPRGDMKFRTFKGGMNGVRFAAFLKELLADTGKPIIVIADNASYHSGKPVKQLVAASDGRLIVDYLPAYSPELNPDEQVWNHAKARLAQRFIATHPQLVQEVRSILKSIQRTPALIRSFFQLKDTRYAA